MDGIERSRAKEGCERGAASSDDKEGRIGRCRRRKGGSGRGTWHRGGSRQTHMPSHESCVQQLLVERKRHQCAK